MPKSPEELAHIEWLGYVQPVGLVVSIPAMLEAQCYVNKNIMAEHARFLNCLKRDAAGNAQPEVRDLREFVQAVLGWESEDLITLPEKGPLPAEHANLEVVLPQYNETLRPTHVVPEFTSTTSPSSLTTNNQPLTPTPQSPAPSPYPPAPKPILLIQELASNIHLDEPLESDSSKHWHASPQAKFERLLRETGVPIGLLFNRSQFRLVYAPRGETSGYATFNVDEMAQVAGRPMFAALHMLLSVERLFSLADKQRLPYILENSRKYQNTVSTALAEQVTSALFELLRGFQAANDQRVGELLRHVLANNPQHVYHGLLTVLMRLVFVLYAEDRDLVSSDPTYTNHYSVSGLFERLRSEAGRFPDTMDQRFGAWAQLLTLFRLVYEGGQHAELKIPARKGYLFDPNRYPFLEGREDWGLGDRDWGLAGEDSGGYKNDSSVVSGSASLAVGDGTDGESLSRDQVISQRGTLRTDQSNASSSEFDSSEHSGGARARQQGIPTVSEDSARKPDRIGNASDTGSASRDVAARATQRTATNDGTTGPNAKQTSAVPQKPTPSPLTPNPKPPIPRISDGVIYRVLEDLLILDGERLSYRTLDVEQIGSVYEAIMGFELQVSAGKSIAIKPVKSHGAPATINLEALLAAKPADRVKLLNDWTDQKLGASDADALKNATSIEGLVAALDKKIAKHVTPGIVPADSMVFQPSDERRRSGSHYTPRSLTQPIVRTTLEPVLKQMYDPEAPLPKVYEPTREDKQRFTAGEIEARIRQSEKRIEYAKAARSKGVPHPNQILDLKVCDPAMGSGAFLVEACRQLADHLVDSWHAHATTNEYETNHYSLPTNHHSLPTNHHSLPTNHYSLTTNHYSLTTNHFPPDIPPDEDEILYARRMVAQRCLYGVDKNIMAVDLAKLSLWLVTLAKDHPFTFLDHSLRHGDSLVGLTREQIISFHWEPRKQKKIGEDLIQKKLDRASEARAKILSAREDAPYRDQEQRMAVANEALDAIRLVGDACVSCFFAADKTKDREKELERVFALASSYFSSLTPNHQQLAPSVDFDSRAALQMAADRLITGQHPIPCFHWEIEFPEVFSRNNGGFDSFVGNPPFLGGRRISTVHSATYRDYLYSSCPGAENLCDLAAYFFRIAFTLIRSNGTLGLVATNTISQGDTREGGLTTICSKLGGTIFNATRRLRWPGQVSVVVSIVHIAKGKYHGSIYLDGAQAQKITSYLHHSGVHSSPVRLAGTNELFSKGSVIYGQGFVFADDDQESTPISEMQRIIELEPNSRMRIYPYMGGSELNTSPTQSPTRFVIYFSDIKEESQLEEWPLLAQVVRQKVKPVRDRLGSNPNNVPLKKKWWAYQAHRPTLYQEIRRRQRVLVCPEVTPHLAFAFVPTTYIFSHKLNVFLLSEDWEFAVLQSRVHELWARFFSSTSLELLSYTPTDCFETFPFPKGERWDELAFIGRIYNSHRADLMLQRNVGLTATYNAFHDKNTSDAKTLELRALHTGMDAAVMRAYGWRDLADKVIRPDFCQFQHDQEQDYDHDAIEQGPRKSNKHWRYRWPDEFRDEVLARLLELNEQRHKEEQLLVKGKSTQSNPDKEPSKKPTKAKATPLLDGLDDVELSSDERLVILVVNAFGLITRRALDEAFIAMKSPKLRKSRLGLGDPPKSVPRTDPERDALIGGLVDQGFLQKHPSDHQQIWKLGPNAPPLTTTATEHKALDETRAIFQKAIDAGNNLASCQEGVTDAQPGLVSIT